MRRFWDGFDVIAVVVPTWFFKKITLTFSPSLGDMFCKQVVSNAPRDDSSLLKEDCDT